MQWHGYEVYRYLSAVMNGHPIIDARNYIRLLKTVETVSGAFSLSHCVTSPLKTVPFFGEDHFTGNISEIILKNRNATFDLKNRRKHSCLFCYLKQKLVPKTTDKVEFFMRISYSRTLSQSLPEHLLHTHGRCFVFHNCVILLFLSSLQNNLPNRNYFMHPDIF